LIAGVEPPSFEIMTSEQKKNNRKMGLILASIAVVFFIGFVAKMFILSH
jgi:hypothetical protein